MLPAIIAALAPILIDEAATALLSDSPAAAKAANAVMSVAAEASGIAIGTADDAAHAAEIILADPVKLAEVYRQQASVILELARIDAADRASARARDLAIAAAGRRNWRADAMVAMAVIGVIACVISLVAGGIDGNTAVGGFIIGVGSLLAGKIGTAFDFEFGSSASSAAKTEMLNRK